MNNDIDFWHSLAGVIDALTYPLVVLNDQLRVVALNKAASELLSLADEPGGRLFDTLLESSTPDRRELSMRILQGLVDLRRDEPLVIPEVTMLRGNGSVFLAELTIGQFAARGLSAGCGFTVTIQDVTGLTKELASLQLSAKAFEFSGEAIMITDPLDRILAVNDAFSRMTGFAEAEILGLRPDFLRRGLNEDAIYLEMWSAVRSSGHWGGEVFNRKKFGEAYPAWLSISAVRNRLGHITQYISIFSDISERKMHEQKLRHLVEHDFLTGLPNRILFQDRFEQALLRYRRGPAKLLAVFFIDLDGFKAVNDRHGHAAGDELLKRVATRLQKALRAEDTVSRHSGDEFVALISDLISIRDITPIAENLHRALAEPFVLPEAKISLTASIGISLYPDHSEGLADLIRMADSAMYSVKRAGKQTWSIHKP